MDDKQKNIMINLGPLRALAGVWEGDKGHDTAPSDERGTEVNLYRERMVFEPFGPVENHEQQMFGLRYSTIAFRLGVEDSFHEDMGYWLWDAKLSQVFRCFVVPRGIAVLAGGKVQADAKQFDLRAKVGDPIFGISSNPFLDVEFKTLSYHLNVKILGANQFSYEADSVLQLKGKSEPFHHIDKNVMTRVSGP